jgi:trehalose 6-phosphate synthase
MRPDLVRIGETHWRRYREVNRRFADAVVEESAGGGAAVWFQDYHLALAPRLVRDQRNDLTLAHFWHIPFPPPEIFGMAPQAREILTGLLANDLLGFQIPRFSANFLRCAAEIAGASVDAGGGTATLDGHRCQIGAFPISIDVPFFASAAGASSVELAAVRAQWVPEGGLLGLGVDRLDYSKGLPQKLAALDWLWEHHPELRRRFSFLQIAVPSRMNIESYDRLAEEIERQVLVINGKYGEEGWRPITIVSHSLPAETLALLYRTADLCLVTSLQDGMNLVAKEYVASQLDQQGSLILSAFAGAAADLKQAILVNPHDPHAVADAIAGALATPLSIRQTRMKRMQRDLHTIHHWMQEFLSAWGRAGGDSGPFCDPSA